MNRTLLTLLFLASVHGIVAQIPDSSFVYQWKTNDSIPSYLLLNESYIINESNCACCNDSLRVDEMLYILDKNRNKLSAYHGKRRVWQTDLKKTFGFEVSFTCMEFFEIEDHSYHSGKNEAVIHLSNNYQCVSVEVDARNGKVD